MRPFQIALHRLRTNRLVAAPASLPAVRGKGGFSWASILNRLRQGGLADDDGETNWLDVLNQGISTAGSIFVANQGGRATTTTTLPGGIPRTTTYSGAAATMASSNTSMYLMLGGAALLAVLLLRKK